MERINLDGTATGKRAEIIGIDLGTTNSAVSVYSADLVPTLLPIGEDGKYTVPSCVSWDGYDADGKPIFTVGATAYRARYKSNVIYSIKRMMGSGHSVTLSRFDENLATHEDLTMTPAQVSAVILGYLKSRVEEFYGKLVRCVITVPAYFDQRQIEDTLEASRLAGLKCEQILKEPTSASYIYSMLGYATNGSILIYDLGGGTFDVTHMTFVRRDSIPQKLLTSLKRQYGIDINKSTADVNDQYFCRVLGTYGDMRLGGDDIDKAMGDIIIENQNLELSHEGEEQLYLKCEEFKKMGSCGMDTTIEGQTIKFTTDDLNSAVDKVFERTMELIRDIDSSQITSIVLVGGSTKSQRIRDNLTAAFPGIYISAVLDPDATVALGAGAVAKALSDNKGLMYADVLPLPIGILVNEKEVEVCIARNTSMPYTAKKMYRTIHDNQEQVTLHLFQGISSKPSECTYLGRLTMKDIPRAKAGNVEILVSFILTGQGMLRIRSSIEGQNREEELVIDNIFDVSSNNGSFFASDMKSEDGGLSPEDDFEENFLSLAKGNEEIEALFKARRRAKKMELSEEERQRQIESYEDVIVEKTMSLMQ